MDAVIVRIYRNYTEETLPMIAWGAEDLVSGDIQRGRSPEEALGKLLAHLDARSAMESQVGPSVNG
jgi:hypothetical protein